MHYYCNRISKSRGSCYNIQLNRFQTSKQNACFGHDEKSTKLYICLNLINSNLKDEDALKNSSNIKK